MQTIYFLNENGANVAVSGVAITVCEPNSSQTYVPETTEMVAKTDLLGRITQKKVVSPSHWEPQPSIIENQLKITSAGQGYRGAGETYTAVNVTFSDYASAMTKEIEKGTPNIVVDLRPTQNRNRASKINSL